MTCVVGSLTARMARAGSGRSPPVGDCHQQVCEVLDRDARPNYGARPSITELPAPQAGPGQVLIAVQAAGMNPMDVQIASGGWRDRMPARFPIVLGADLAGAVHEEGPGAARFAPGDEVFGQLLIPPLGSAGTYAEYVACREDAPLARIPAGLDPVTAAALPTAGGAGMAIAESLAPLDGKTVLIVGVAGAVGSFATQFTARADAHVAAVAPAAEAGRMKGYGAAETIDQAAPLPEAVASAHPDGIDVLIDVASDAGQFAALAGHVRPGGTAVTTRYVADEQALARAGVTGVNFALHATVPLLERLASWVAAGSVIPPPITRLSLDEVAALLGQDGHAAGKAVITM
jgi:NADPH2:quinone reductase